MMLSPLNAADPSTIPTIVEIWNAACEGKFAISERFVRYNLNKTSGTEVTGCFANKGGKMVGFVLARAVTGQVTGLSADAGWIDALAVVPDMQGQGIGSRLLAWAETHLSGQGHNRFRIGGSPRPFSPGAPDQLRSSPFFLGKGYQPRSEAGFVWDLARSVNDYAPPAFVPQASLKLRPLRNQDIDAFDTFFCREFPGRWRYDFQVHIRQGGRLADYTILWDGQKIEGFFQLTLEDSNRPMDRYYFSGLPHPWGQLGPIGVSAHLRGQGVGSSLLDAGLSCLKTLGIATCVIDWVSYPAFYQKFGFRLHTGYHILIKERGCR